MAKISTLTNPFTTALTGFTGTSGQTGIDTGVPCAYITCATGYPNLTSAVKYDFTDSNMWAEIGAPGTASGIEAYFRGQADANNYFGVGIGSGSIYVTSRNAGAAAVQNGSRTYNATTDRYWGVTLTGTTGAYTCTGWVSPDGATWNKLGTCPVTFDPTNINAFVQSGYWSTNAGTRTTIKGFNIGTGPPVTTGPVQTVAARKITALVETFDRSTGSSFAGNNGSGYDAATARLKVPCTTAYPSAYTTAKSDARNARWTSRWWPAVDPAGGSMSGYSSTMRLTDGQTTDTITLGLSGGTWQGYTTKGGVQSATVTKAYDPVGHAFVQVVDTGDTTLTVQGSPDCVTWVPIITVDHTGVSVANADVTYQSGHGAGKTDAAFYVDHINVRPTHQSRMPDGTVKWVHARVNDGATYKTVVGPTTPPSVTATQPPGTPATLSFDAAYPTRGVQAYLDDGGSLNPNTGNAYLDGAANPAGAVAYGTELRLVPDPAGSGRQVMLFASDPRKSTSNGYPRAGALCGFKIKPYARGNTRDEYWMGLSLYVPSTYKTTGTSDWISIASGGFGPPYNGASPLGISVSPVTSGGTYQGYHRISMGALPEVLGAVPFVFDTWVYVVIHWRQDYMVGAPGSTPLNPDGRGGMAEVFMKFGDQPWARIPLQHNKITPITGWSTQAGMVPYPAMMKGVNDDYVTWDTTNNRWVSNNACYSSNGSYSEIMSWDGKKRAISVHSGHHLIGYTREAINQAPGWPELPAVVSNYAGGYGAPNPAPRFAADYVTQAGTLYPTASPGDTYAYDATKNPPTQVSTGVRAGVDYKPVPDPLNPARTVMLLDSGVSMLSTGNPNPRVALDTANSIMPGDELWVANEFFIPSDSPFHTNPTAGDWIVVAQPSWGPPFLGNPTVAWAVVHAFPGGTFQEHRLSLGVPNVIGTVPCPTGVWVQIVTHFKQAYDTSTGLTPSGGFLETFINTGAGWRRIPVNGVTTGPAPYGVLVSGKNDDAVTKGGSGSYSDISSYSLVYKDGVKQGIKVLHANHSVASTRGAMNAGCMSGWVPLPDPATVPVLTT